MPLRVGYVREHFASPLLQFADDDKGDTFTLVECPGGTGQLIAALADDKVDLVIALTDPLIAGIGKGNKTYRLVGSYVCTPLNWAVITGNDSKFKSIDDLKGTTIGISRPGSGSQTMAYVMALQHEWLAGPQTHALKFQVNNDIHGLVKSVNDGTTSAFMWEWFTTKPWLDKGEVRFIGSVLTPWPSWMIAAHTSPERAPHAEIRRFVATLTGYVRAFDSKEKRLHGNVEFIKERFGYPEEDIKAWMETVGYPEDCTAIPGKVITDTLHVLVTAGVLTRPEGGFSTEDFTLKDVVRLI
ncbi:periplasmic binding protein-like II [Sistotremastrum niveocremeum HHB9708]|uniref:Periplasmic binding protein-like II n=1 Tax=Sistotremastrum niveocremeum HHB9708 TaxID=1314777 RepID=A0A164NJL5_9AGAM|nr:periplasmic binding protein-like II [Sistotremastrum niveocremeum HHB9708]